MSLLNELKRRNVFKVGAAYLALAWLVLQLTSIVVPAFELPVWTLKFVIWFGVIGFPCALVFAWIYELTPEGLKRDSEVDPGKSITQLTGKRLDYVIVVLLVLAIGMAAMQYIRPPAAPVVATGDSTVTPPATAAEVTTPVPTAPELTVVPPNDKSIAVLPFVNMSSDEEQEYFSDGMSEELLNLLAKAPDLKVIARTSSFAFKGKDVSIAEIARQLNVAHVLEGSVRKAGNTVRITAQLIRTADSTHLWSESYDRPMDDIFKVQDEIANAIAQALQIRLKGGALSRREGGTKNLQAYELFQRGVHMFKPETPASLDDAARYFEQAIALDDNFSLARVWLARTLSNQAYEGMIDIGKGFEQARAQLQRALEISPELAQVHSELQFIYQSYDFDWAAARSAGQKALAIDPADPWALQTDALLSASLGQWRDAEQKHRTVVALDPLNPYARFEVASTMYCSRNFPQAEELLRNEMSRNPDWDFPKRWLAKTLLAQGRADEALAIIERESDEAKKLILLPVLLKSMGRTEEAYRAQQGQVARWSKDGPFWIAMSYAYQGEHELALTWLDRAFEQRDSGLVSLLCEKLDAGFRNDPRFKAFLRKMNLPETPPG